MAVASNRARTEHTSLQWREQEAGSPERTKVWMVPAPPKPKPRPLKAAVVYYLSRNGHLEHPHFMEVSLSSPDGLYLGDVINRLNALRGKGMSRMYLWSSKRSYKNGFVWHDLADDDYIHPVNGHEYVLKGTELLVLPLLAGAGAAASSCSGSRETPTSSSSGSEISKPARDDADEFVAVKARRKKAGAWSSLDLGEYKVYKSEENAVSAADAATQTDDYHRRHHRTQAQEELNREEISPPPPSSSSPETLEALIKADGSIVTVGDRAVIGGGGVGRTRAPSVLMQLISCGSISVKGGHSLPVMAQYRVRLPPAAMADPGSAEVADAVGEMPSFRRKVVEDKQYFSGSLVETKRTPVETAGEFPVLRRSSSCNADRVLKAELPKEIEDLHDRCIPRKPKMKKESYSVISQNAHGSKRAVRRKFVIW